MFLTADTVFASLGSVCFRFFISKGTEQRPGRQGDLFRGRYVVGG